VPAAIPQPRVGAGAEHVPDRRRLAEQGLAVVLISHNMHDVMEVADYITVLRLGQTVAEFKKSETSQREVVEAITAGTLKIVPGMQDEVIA